jgi:hypothetical protein
MLGSSGSPCPADGYPGMETGIEDSSQSLLGTRESGKLFLIHNDIDLLIVLLRKFWIHEPIGNKISPTPKLFENSLLCITHAAYCDTCGTSDYCTASLGK